MERAYAVDKVFSTVIPSLQHGNDGLIYTCVTTPYTAGTDTNMCAPSTPLAFSPARAASSDGCVRTA